MEEVLVTAVKWTARGVGLALDYINLRDAIKQFRRDVRKNFR
ncbi:hypothetical protein [Streptomyces sp. NPDC001927]